MKANKKLNSVALASAILILALILFSSTVSAAAEKLEEEQFTFTEEQSNDTQSESSTQFLGSAQNINKVYGINFSPYMDGQSPDYGSQIDKNQITNRMKIIAPYTKWIRTYGTENGLEYSGPVAHEMGLKTAIGAWLSGDTEANERQISKLIDEAKAGNVDLAIVGSETLLRNDLSEDQLIKYIQRVKQSVPAGINVTTADTYSELLNHPKVMDECDVIMYNSYPYWEGISIDKAMEVQDSRYKNLVKNAKNKPVIVSETGWPSAGNTIGDAVPSPENSARYLNDSVSWARKNNIQYFYFEAFDETWKSVHEGPQGAHWGVWDKDGNMKPGMERVFPPETAPKANFSASLTSGKAPLNVKFTDKSTGTPTYWYWNFGDGSKSYLQNPTHKYSKAGAYTVSLIVKNAAGRSTVTKTGYIKVISKPVAAFSASPTSGKAPLNVKFTDKSTGIPAFWYWNFGDGSKSYLQNPVHKYSKAGTYTVSLIVKNSAGRGAVTKTGYIKVISKPVASFSGSPTSGKAPLNVKFTDKSTGIPAGWIWNFGDGSKSYIQNPTHKYSKAGAYTVSLTVKNTAGRSTVTKTGYIKTT
ncbi:Chitin binding protein [Methanosarcina sp. Kolksee]|uniref:PKD domain-containing protein n=1 Tax=Methanosarcina sp. Kolksee TaxID=1434099 RepID=UPI000615C564|nr:PKD domain-containing protein [Methanosarcina sp. Kolksee]AKB48841.1 Chitin binding protein [Methanosarcina sp. Kolksee]